MKKFLVLLVLSFSLQGCGSIPENYVDADERTYNAVAPEYEGYVRSGQRFNQDGTVMVDEQGQPVHLSEDEQGRRLRNLRFWKLRIDEAKQQLAETAPVQS